MAPGVQPCRTTTPLRAQDDPFDIDVGEDDEEDDEETRTRTMSDEDEEGGWQVGRSPASGLTLYG